MLEKERSTPWMLSHTPHPGCSMPFTQQQTASLLFNSLYHIRIIIDPNTNTAVVPYTLEQGT
jgi:hypothetical protein